MTHLSYAAQGCCVTANICVIFILYQYNFHLVHTLYLQDCMSGEQNILTCFRVLREDYFQILDWTKLDLQILVVYCLQSWPGLFHWTTRKLDSSRVSELEKGHALWLIHLCHTLCDSCTLSLSIQKHTNALLISMVILLFYIGYVYPISPV